MATGEDEYYIIRFEIDGFGTIYHSDSKDIEAPMSEAKRFESNEIKEEYERLKKEHPDIPIEVLKVEIWVVDEEEIDSTR